MQMPEMDFSQRQFSDPPHFKNMAYGDDKCAQTI